MDAGGKAVHPGFLHGTFQRLLVESLFSGRKSPKRIYKKYPHFLESLIPSVFSDGEVRIKESLTSASLAEMLELVRVLALSSEEVRLK